MAEDEAVAVAAPVRFERRNASQGSMRDRIDKATERVSAISDKLIGTRPRSSGMDQKGMGRSLEQLEAVLSALEEGL